MDTHTPRAPGCLLAIISRSFCTSIETRCASMPIWQTRMKYMKSRTLPRANRALWVIAAWGVISLLGCTQRQDLRHDSVAGVMGSVVTRLYDELTPTQLDTLGADFILGFIAPEEKAPLATAYWKFGVNVPVVVPVIRDE